MALRDRGHVHSTHALSGGQHSHTQRPLGERNGAPAEHAKLFDPVVNITLQCFSALLQRHILAQNVSSSSHSQGLLNEVFLNK